MKENAINWDAVPDVITKDQLYRICHISKSTALYLLQSGKIPCEYTGRKTRCYKIKKEDVIAYLENRKVFPESSPPRRAGTKAIILSRWRNRFPKSCWSIYSCTIPSCSPAIPMY